MTEFSLYRKYRPANFGEVVGQDEVVSVLGGALARGQVSHAYLFAGSRGTGKTSVARIVARELGTSEKDLYEIDAASARGIDDVRELREGIAAHPFESRYKVYIIDEAHMLTREAFNALLKTLEEPPAHAIFILATTEPEKLPETVVSRCEVHRFRRPPRALLREHIADIAAREGVSLESSAAELVALAADGSFRDAQSVLQKVLGAAGGKRGATLGVADIESLVGAPPRALVNRLVSAVAARDAREGLSALADAARANADMRMFAALLLEKLRAALLLRHAPDMRAALKEELPSEDIELLAALAEASDSGVNARALSTFLAAYADMRNAHIPQIPLELAVITLSEQRDR